MALVLGRFRWVGALLAVMVGAGCSGSAEGHGSASGSPGPRSPASGAPVSRAPRSASPKAHTLVFRIAGEGRLSFLSYAVNGKETTERAVELPWHRTIQLPARAGEDTWHLKTRGSARIEVEVDGEYVTGGACAGDGTCSSDDGGSIGD